MTVKEIYLLCVCLSTMVPNDNLILLLQPQGQSLDDIVVSVPQTPAHGAVARLPSQVTKILLETGIFRNTSNLN